MNTRFNLATIVLPAISMAVVATVIAAVASRLPDPMAVHWGVSGAPDGFMSQGGFVVTTIAVLVAVGGLMALIARMASGAMVGARILTGMPLGMVWLIGSLLVFTALIQLDASSAVRLPAWLIPTALVLGALGTAAGATIAGEGERPPASSSPAPADAARMDLADGATAIWVGRTPPMRAMPLLAASMVLVGLVLAWLTDWIVLAGMLPAILIVVAMSSFRVVIGREGVAIHGLFFGLPRMRVPIGEIAEAAPGSVSFKSFGGWGIRIRPGGESAVLTRSGDALVITRTDGAKLRVSLDEPQQPAAVLSTLLDRRA